MTNVVQLSEAKALLEANGYRVTKTRKPKAPAKRKALKKTLRVGPTCVVHWADGNVTRMSTFCEDHALDFERGIRLNTAAWESRNRRNHPIPFLSRHYAQRMFQHNPIMNSDRLRDYLDGRRAKVPEIVDCYFQRDGEIIGVWPQSTHRFPVEQERLAA